MTMKRQTIQNTLIFETVSKLHCHATADEVYTAIAQDYPNISRATVYRNLNQLSECNAIRKIEVPGGADRFDHQCFDHYHAKCCTCGQIFDVDMACLVDLEQSIHDSNGFEFCGHDIMFKGTCSTCAT